MAFLYSHLAQCDKPTPNDVGYVDKQGLIKECKNPILATDNAMALYTD